MSACGTGLMLELSVKEKAQLPWSSTRGPGEEGLGEALGDRTPAKCTSGKEKSPSTPGENWTWYTPLMLPLNL